MVLTAEQKTLLFDAIPTVYEVNDIDGNPHDLTFKKFQAKQDQKREFPCVVVDWTNEGDGDWGIPPQVWGRATTEELLDSNTNLQHDSEVVGASNIVEIEFAFTDNYISSIHIFTNKLYDTTSFLKFSLIRDADSKTVASGLVHNASIRSNDYTALSINTYVYIDEIYTLKLEEYARGANAKGINVYRDVNRSYLYKVYTVESKEIHGEPQKTTMVISVLSKHIEGVGYYIDGRTICEAVVSKIGEEAWNEFRSIFKVNIEALSGATDSSGVEGGEYIYHLTFTCVLVYHVLWSKEETFIRDVNLTIN